MRYSSFTTLVLGLANLAAAAISSPSSGDSWSVGTNHEIMWDTTGLTGPCDIHLVPAGATDISVVVTDIVLGTGNTGSYQWAPDKSITTINVAIIIVDAMKTLVKSEDFIIIIIEDGTLLTSTKKTSSTVKTTIKTTALTLSTSKALTTSVLMKTTSTLLATSIKTTTLSTSTKLTSLLSTSTKLASLLSTSTKATTTALALTSSTTKATINTATLTTPAILSIATFKPLNSTTLKVTSATVLGVMTTSKPLTTSMTTLKPTTTTIASVASLVKQNATTSATKPVFTGAAAHDSANLYSLVSGGVVGVIAVFFL